MLQPKQYSGIGFSITKHRLSLNHIHEMIINEPWFTSGLPPLYECSEKFTIQVYRCHNHFY